MALAVFVFFVSALNASSGLEPFWSIVFAPLLLAYAFFFAGTPAALVGLGLMFRNNWITAAFVIAALIFQILTWPDEPDCGFRRANCEDPFGFYRVIVAFCWIALGMLAVVRVKNSHDRDPYIVALRKRRGDYVEPDLEEHPEMHLDDFREAEQDEGLGQQAEKPVVVRDQGRKKQYWEKYKDD